MANALQRMAARVLGLATEEDVRRIAESLLSDRDRIDQLPGWTLMSGSGDTVAPPELIQRIQQEAQAMWIKDPLLKQAVGVKRHFVLGGGISFTAEDPDIDQVLHTFWRDDLERMPMQLTDWFNSLQVGAELCLRFYPALNGMVRVRMIPLAEVADVITNPDDRHEIRFIRHKYSRREFNQAAMSYMEMPLDELIPGEEVLWLAVNKPSGWVRGISPLYAAIPWAKAYSEWLQDRVKLNKAKGAWAWIRKVTGGIAAVTAGAAKLAADIGGKVKSAVTGVDDSKAPPKPGSVITANQNVDWQVINAKVGADDAKEDGRALKLQVAAATNVFEHYFGDASVANLASAKAMELPMLRECEDLQDTMGWVLSHVFRRLLRAQVDAHRLPDKYSVTREVLNDGSVVEVTEQKATVDCPVDINFPPLRSEDRLQNTQAAEIEQRMGVKSDATLASELGVEDWEQERTRLFKQRQEQDARDQAQLSDQYPPFPDPGGKG